MHGTRTVTVTRRYQTNKSHIDSNYSTKQQNTDEKTIDHLKMNNNNNEKRQSARFLRIDNHLRYHWSADDEIIPIINRREKSPETTELVTR